MVFIVSVLSSPEGVLSPFRSLRSLDGDTHLHLRVRSRCCTAMEARLTGVRETIQAGHLGAWAGREQVARRRSTRVATGSREAADTHLGAGRGAPDAIHQQTNLQPN